MLRIEGKSFEEEMLYAESIGDEKYQRQLKLANETIGIMGWDIDVNSNVISRFAEQYTNIVSWDPSERRYVSRPGTKEEILC